MKAAVVERPGELTVREVPDPELGEYDALCEILCGATCSGTDSHIIHGRMPFPIQYPTILGHESTGRVLEVGKRVRDFSPGDLVTKPGTLAPSDGSLSIAWGGFAEYGVVRDRAAMQEDGVSLDDGWNFMRVNRVLAPDMNPAAATMITTWRETLSCLTRMGFQEGSTLLVLGSGGNALSFVAHAKNLGASYIVLIGNPARFDAARAAGADDCFDYRDEKMAESITKKYPKGFQFVIDAVGKAGMIDAALPVLAADGVVNVYGIDDFGGLNIHPRLARGSFRYFATAYDEAEAHDRVIEFMDKGLLDARIWLDLEHPYPLSKINDAFDAVEERKVIKAVITVKD